MSHYSECKRERRHCLCVTCANDDGGKCCDKHDPGGGHCPLTICVDYKKESARQEAT